MCQTGRIACLSRLRFSACRLASRFRGAGSGPGGARAGARDIERVDGDTYFVKARDGAELKLKLAGQAMVVALIKASLADIKQGSYVGVAAMPLADGSQKALEVQSSPRPCAAPATDIAAGICSRRAP